MSLQWRTHVKNNSIHLGHPMQTTFHTLCGWPFPNVQLTTITPNFAKPCKTCFKAAHKKGYLTEQILVKLRTRFTDTRYLNLVNLLLKQMDEKK